MPWKFSLPYFAEGAREDLFKFLLEGREGNRLASGTSVNDECTGGEAPGLEHGEDPALQEVPANGEF
jgi:hypothetical protein